MATRKPRTTIQTGQSEISIVTFVGHQPIRTSVKKMTARQALNIARAHKIDAGTEYTVEHVVVDGHGFDGPVVRTLGHVQGQVYAVGCVPAGY